MVEQWDGRVAVCQFGREVVELALPQHAGGGAVVGVEADEPVARMRVAEGDGEVLRSRHEAGGERAVETIAQSVRPRLALAVERATLPPVMVAAGDEVVPSAA